MIQCKRCGTTYETGSRYCNVCQVEITNENSSKVYDNNDLKTKLKRFKRNIERLKWLDLTILLLFPFMAFSGYIPLLSNTIEKTIVCTIVASLCGISLYTRDKYLKITRIASITLSALLIALYPLATPFGIAIFILLLKT